MSNDTTPDDHDRDGPEPATDRDGPEPATDHDGPEPATDHDGPEPATDRDGPEPAGDPAVIRDPSRAVSDLAALEADVPAGATSRECPHCQAVFPDDRSHDLHIGRAHADVADEDAVERHATAVAAEADALRSFRLRALAVLVVVYFGFLFLFALVR